MQQIGEWQNEFASALIHPDLPVPQLLTNPIGEPCPKRFAVYRNNVVSGLVEALMDTFPAVCRIVGIDFFRAMAQIYALQNPPRSPILLEYGSNFADFIERFEPAASLPYLSDVCRIERAWLDAYHAREAVPVCTDELRMVPPPDIPNLRIKLHPSARLLRSRYPALTIWGTNIEGGVPMPIDLEAGGEDVLIVRPEADVEVHGLTHSEMEFITALSEGAAILNATNRALNVDPGFLFPTALEGLIRAGIVAELNVNSMSPLHCK
jgi:Putative DNA-binding domain